MFGNWKPDFLSAVPYLDRAGALYKAAGADEQAKEMFIKSAECNVSHSRYIAMSTACVSVMMMDAAAYICI